MIMTSLLYASALAIMATGPATAAPPAVQALTGPVIAGVCVVSPEAVLAGSKVGQAVTLRLQKLAQDAQQEVQAERTALETEAKALQAPAKGVSTTQLDQRRAALATRVKALQDKAAERNRELEYTRNKQVVRISNEAQPLIAAAYSSHGCGLLFRRESLIAGNPTNDLTPDVVRGLDGKITTLTFDREAPPPPRTASTGATGGTGG